MVEYTIIQKEIESVTGNTPGQYHSKKFKTPNTMMVALLSASGYKYWEIGAIMNYNSPGTISYHKRSHMKMMSKDKLYNEQFGRINKNLNLN